MSVLEKCSSCRRKGGYSEAHDDKICARCKSRNKTGRDKVQEGDKE